jgi:uncharacterized membrane protein YkvA (DUF1232 family)
MFPPCSPSEIGAPGTWLELVPWRGRAQSCASAAVFAQLSGFRNNRYVASRLSSLFVRPSLMGALFGELRLAWRLMREPRVPAAAKAVPVLAMLYVVSPLDFIPDVLPVLGQIDDLGILILSVKAFLRLCPPAVAAFHTTALTSGRRYAPMAPTDVVIDATYRRD